MSQSTVWVLITYNRGTEDEVEVFSRREDAEAEALEYALAFWPEELGAAPLTYQDLETAWNKHGLWGTDDARWELAGREVR